MFTHRTHIGWAITVAIATGLQGVASRAVEAQADSLLGDSVGIGRARFIVGRRWLDLSELNGRMAGAGLTTFKEELVSIGATVLGGKGRLLTGVEGRLLLGAPPPEGERTSALLGGVGQLDLGYLLYSGRRFALWPTLGLGAGIVGFDVARTSQPSFDDVLTDPGQGSRLESSGLLTDLSLDVEYRFGEVEGLVVGFGLGYTRAWGGWGWKVDGIEDVALGPRVAIEGLHVEISLGGWGGPVG
jgi:hypothetical protein